MTPTAADEAACASCGAVAPPGRPSGERLAYLQELRVLLAQLLQQSGQQVGVLLDGLPHVEKLGLVPQEGQGVLSWTQSTCRETPHR